MVIYLVVIPGVHTVVMNILIHHGSTVPGLGTIEFVSMVCCSYKNRGDHTKRSHRPSSKSYDRGRVTGHKKRKSRRSRVEPYYPED